MEKQLISRLKHGDSRSFAELVEAYQERIINVCYAFTHNQQDAEDVAQEVFIEIFQAIDKFRGDARLSTWINRIAINRSLDLLRKKKRKKRTARLQSIFGITGSADEPAAPQTASPDYKYEQGERARILQAAVKSLPENQGIAITLSQYQGYDNNEIAEIMGMTVSAVVSLLHRAKKNLYRQLFKYYKKNI
jgi:RNA polymerase sigma-70 factor (ECF subfamily)